MRVRAALAVLALALVAFGPGAPRRSAADGDRFKVVVNPDLAIGEVDRDLLRAIYLKKAARWSDGTTVRPVDLGRRYGARERFTREVLKKTPSQLRSYWNQRVFSGKGVPPPEAETPEAVVAYVLAHPGAIGYLPADADPGHARVVTIR